MPNQRKRPLPRQADTVTAGSGPTNKRAKRTVAKGKREKRLVERINALGPLQFSAQYFPHRAAEAFQSSTGLRLSLLTWEEMRPALREACVKLVEMTSARHYRASEMGWSRAKKVKEMRHPAMKYVLILAGGKQGDEADVVEGFLSFMVTDEDHYEVIYCYELHLQPRLQGKGLGRRLMGLMEMVGARVGVEKAMLTVFRSNERAAKVYGKWGYGLDEFSPEPRRLREGPVKERSYVILSKERKGFAQEEKCDEHTDACGLQTGDNKPGINSKDKSCNRTASSK